MKKVVDLGSRHSLRQLHREIPSPANPVAEGIPVIGFIWEHPRPDGAGQCKSLVPLRRENVQGWAMLSEDPITLDPSLQCHLCGAHGYVREGSWHDHP